MESKDSMLLREMDMLSQPMAQIRLSAMNYAVLPGVSPITKTECRSLVAFFLVVLAVLVLMFAVANLHCHFDRGVIDTRKSQWEAKMREFWNLISAELRIHYSRNTTLHSACLILTTFVVFDLEKNLLQNKQRL